MALNIHASCVALGRAGNGFGAPAEAGVLLLGPSGAGKSDLALRLIATGAELVADDRTELAARDGALIAAPPPALAGLIEVRNVGIVALPYRARVRLAVAIDLAQGGTPERLPEAAYWQPPPGDLAASSVRLRLIRLNPFEASAPAKVAVATAAVMHDLLRGTVAAP